MKRSWSIRESGVGLLAATLVVMAGCRDNAPDQGIVEIANLARTAASFHWQSPGVLGTAFLGGSGSEPIAACSAYARGFAPGDQQLTISSSQGSRSFTLAAPSSGQVVLWIVIRADGTIAETPADQVPASPYCR